MLGYVLAKADEVLVISGGKRKRVVYGGTFVPPVIRRSQKLSLKQVQTTVTEVCLSKENIRVQLTATCSFKVDSTPEGVLAAAERFVSDQNQMENLVRQPVCGHLREIAGSMTVQQLVAERETLRAQVLKSCKEELVDAGLAVDSFQVASVETPPDEEGRDYIALLAAPNISERERDSRIATAKNEQLAAQAEQESKRNQAGYTRDTAIKQAQLNADAAEEQAKAEERSKVADARAEGEINAATARAAQARALADAQARQAVITEESKVAEQTVELTRRQLQATQIEPAEAAKKAKVAAAEADAEATKLHALALEQGGRVSLEQKKIELLPDIAAALAHGLADANVTVLNGPGGLTELITGLLAQGDAILNTIRTVPTATDPPEEGSRPKSARAR